MWGWNIFMKFLFSYCVIKIFFVHKTVPWRDLHWDFIGRISTKTAIWNNLFFHKYFTKINNPIISSHICKKNLTFFLFFIKLASLVYCAFPGACVPHNFRATRVYTKVITHNGIAYCKHYENYFFASIHSLCGKMWKIEK